MRKKNYRCYWQDIKGKCSIGKICRKGSHAFNPRISGDTPENKVETIKKAIEKVDLQPLPWNYPN